MSGVPSSSAIPLVAEVSAGSDLQKDKTHWLAAFSAAIFLLGVVLNLTHSILMERWMEFVEDDFFYYLKIADNLAHGAGSTFNGLVATNGYHPLWLLVLTAVRRLSSSPEMLKDFLGLAMLLAYGSTFFFARRILRGSGGGVLISTALAIYLALNCLRLFIGAMEVLLAIPLMLAVIWLAQKVEFWSRGFAQVCCLALMISAMVLSRLDTLIFAAMIYGGIVLHRDLRSRVSRPVLLGFAAGLLPLVAYVASNRIFFHTWMPVSGMAKQLRMSHEPALATFHSVYRNLVSQRTQMLGAMLCLAALIMLPVVFKRMSAMQRVVYPAALLFPLVYYTLLSFLSDWQLWEWYLYPLRVALCAAFAVFFLWPPVQRLLNLPVVGAVACVAVMVLSLGMRDKVGQEALMLEVANRVRNFATTHPGVYAMGDRSGVVGYLLPGPMVQTEGLVMDRDFLERLRQQRPLREALAKYDVRYYVTTIHPPFPTGCVQIAEPLQAGKTSMHMEAEFCEPPVMVIDQENLRTLVYDLKTN